MIETKTTWGDVQVVEPMGARTAYEYSEPDAPKGDGWIPFAAGFSSPGFTEDGMGRTRHVERDVRYTIWMREY